MRQRNQNIVTEAFAEQHELSRGRRAVEKQFLRRNQDVRLPELPDVVAVWTIARHYNIRVCPPDVPFVQFGARGSGVRRDVRSVHAVIPMAVGSSNWRGSARALKRFATAPGRIREVALIIRSGVFDEAVLPDQNPDVPTGESIPDSLRSLGRLRGPSSKRAVRPGYYLEIYTTSAAPDLSH